MRKVYWYKALHNKWRAASHILGKQVHIGYFDSEVDAARAYDCHVRKVDPQFAYLNFPDGEKENG